MTPQSRADDRNRHDPGLRIRLLGAVCVEHRSVRVDVNATRTVQALLAYLMLHGSRACPREVLADLLWGELERRRALASLSTTLWRLRRVLEPPGVRRGTYLPQASSGDVVFNWTSDYWLDVAAFETAVVRRLARPLDSTSADDAAALERAVQLYTGDLLEGVYFDWALAERERLRLLHLDALSRLMHYHGRNRQFETALTYGRQIVRIDPLREDVHREVMRLYLRNGQRALAVRQYETCRAVLAAELGIPPMEETLSLFEQMVPRDAAGAAVLPDDDLDHALRQLRIALHGFDQARDCLRQAIELTERFSRPRPLRVPG